MAVRVDDGSPTLGTYAGGTLLERELQPGQTLMVDGGAVIHA